MENRPGDDTPAKVEEGLEHSRVLVLCMSAHVFGSDWTQLEAGTFRFRDPLNSERRFIPLRLDDAPIKGSLAQLPYISWRAGDDEQEYVKLLEACHAPLRCWRENYRYRASSSQRRPSGSTTMRGLMPIIQRGRKARPYRLAGQNGATVERGDRVVRERAQRPQKRRQQRSLEHRSTQCTLRLR